MGKQTITRLKSNIYSGHITESYMRYWPFCLVTQCSYLCKTRQKRLRGRQQFTLLFFNLTTLKTRWYSKVRYNRLFTTVPTPWSFHMGSHVTSGMEPLVLYIFSLRSQLRVTTLLKTRLIESCATLWFNWIFASIPLWLMLIKGMETNFRYMVLKWNET